MKPRKLAGALKKAPAALLKVLAVIVKETKPQEIEVNKNGSIVFKYKKEF